MPLTEGVFLDGPPVAQTCQSPFCGLFAAGPKEITYAPRSPLKAGIGPQKTAAALTAIKSITAPRRAGPPQTSAR
jgi:hypothetical protein